MIYFEWPQVKNYKLPTAPAGVSVIHDDLLHPVLGGNKLRKLDGLLPALQASGVTDVVRLPIQEPLSQCRGQR